MTSAAHRSESALGELAVEGCARRRSPRVLLGGLGMGFTLRAALDRLPPRARVVVAELHPAVLEWCRGPLAPLTDGAVRDPRVEVRIADVAQVVAAAEPASFDVVALDLFAGPRAPRPDDPHYGRAALERMGRVLRDEGALAIWSEQPDPAFAKLLTRAGFTVSRRRPGRGGLRHVVYVATPRGNTAKTSQGARRQSGDAQ